MTTEPSNSNDITNADVPLTIERRKPDADALMPEDDLSELPPIEVSDKVTVYSAQSQIRHPVQLIQDIIADFVTGRELAWRLFLRNLRGMYRQTLLGLFWVFLPPIANTAFWVFLKNAAVFDITVDVHPTVYILTGMILWQAFIDAYQMPLGMLNKNKNMISKLNFPCESLLLVGVGEVLFNLTVRMLLLIPAFLIFGVAFHPSMLLAPFAVVGLVLLATAMGLLILPLGSLYQDVGRFIGIMMPFWMILTPTVYPPFTSFPLSLLNWLNPASPLLLVARDWLLVGSSDHLFVAAMYGAAVLPLLLMGLVVYRISIPVLVERMTA